MRKRWSLLCIYDYCRTIRRSRTKPNVIPHLDRHRRIDNDDLFCNQIHTDQSRYTTTTGTTGPTSIHSRMGHDRGRGAAGDARFLCDWSSPLLHPLPYRRGRNATSDSTTRTCHKRLAKDPDLVAPIKHATR